MGEWVLILHLCWSTSCYAVVMPKVYPDIEICSDVAIRYVFSGNGKVNDWRCQRIAK